MEDFNWDMIWIADCLHAQDEAIKNSIEEGLIYEDGYLTIHRENGKIIYRGKPIPCFFTYKENKNSS